MKTDVKEIVLKFFKRFRIGILFLVLLAVAFGANQVVTLNQNQKNLNNKLATTQKDLQALKNQDQYKRNEKLQTDIKSIETTYKKAVASYESLLDLKTLSKKTDKFDELFAKALSLLSQRNYTLADTTLNDLDKQIADEKAKIAATVSVNTQNATAVSSNSPPSNGYRFQSVKTDSGTFNVSIVAADLNSTRVIVDTASDSDCSNNCPVLSLGDYVARNNAFAGINGSFFCPA